MTDAGVVTSARVTHQTGDVDALAAASPESERAGVEPLRSREAVDEAFVLSTCNRVEAYVVTDDADAGSEVLADFFAASPAESVIESGHEESLRHLLRVACGLESVVLGEDQIIGQVRDAYEVARDCGAIGSTLETAVTKAIHVGERARTETAINEGIVSLGSAAARLADREVGLESATVLVVGAGEMGRLAARSLADQGAENVVVANRTIERAEQLLADLEVAGTAVPLADLASAAAEARVIVTATGSTEPVLGPSQLGEREQVVVDLGQPRDVDPEAGSVPGVTVYDLDAIESITAQTRERRGDAAEAVETIVDREFDLLLEQFKRTRADEVIAAMYESAERTKERELQTALSRLEGEDAFTDAQREVVEAMADALVGQLLAPPTKSLRDAAAEDDWSTINTALQLFDPDLGPDGTPVGIPTPAAVDAAPEGEPGDGDSPVGLVEDD